MREKTTVLLALFLIFGMTAVVFVVPSAASVSPDAIDYEPFDVGPELRATDGKLHLEGFEGVGQYGASLEGEESSYFNVGDVIYGLWYDDITGLYLDYYYLAAIGTYAEVWVNLNLAWADPEDPRPVPVVTQEQIDYLLSEFDNNIYSVLTDYFGVPDMHDGTNAVLNSLLGLPADYYYEESGRSIIMVSNIGDENWYDSEYPYYIAGFYWSTYEYYFDRNIINVDAYNWEDRVGPDVARPYLYEGLIAHEYQHLIHADYQPGDETFINEGCSMFSEILTGYSMPWGDINSYLATPDNSLTDWEDQGGINILADYGAAALWAIYLNDQFGDNYWSDYMASGTPGIAGLEALFGGMSFDDVFRNWRIANLIHSDYPGGGKYNYKTLDLGEADPVRQYEIQKLPVPWTTGSDFGTTVTILGYDADGPGELLLGPYASDYIALTKWQKQKPWLKMLSFDGDDAATVEGPGWTFDGTYWYSGAGDLMNTLIVGDAYVDPANPTLTLTTYYDIEDFWDFGFVQVSTDGGMTWTSLANAYTTDIHDPGAISAVIDNLPGLTGWSGDWVPMSFDLSAYADTTVTIGFRFVTDWATYYEGWYLDSPAISGVPLELDLVPAEADFQVSLVYYMKFRGEYYPVLVQDLTLNDMNEEGMAWIPISKPAYVVMVVSGVHEQGVADYGFDVDFIHKRHCWSWGE